MTRTPSPSPAQQAPIGRAISRCGRGERPAAMTQPAEFSARNCFSSLATAVGVLGTQARYPRPPANRGASRASEHGDG